MPKRSTMSLLECLCPLPTQIAIGSRRCVQAHNIFMDHYSPARVVSERRMQRFFSTRSERDNRQAAGCLRLRGENDIT